MEQLKEENEKLWEDIEAELNTIKAGLIFEPKDELTRSIACGAWKKPKGFLLFRYTKQESILDILPVITVQLTDVEFEDESETKFSTHYIAEKFVGKDWKLQKESDQNEFGRIRKLEMTNEELTTADDFAETLGLRETDIFDVQNFLNELKAIPDLERLNEDE